MTRPAGPLEYVVDLTGRGHEVRVSLTCDVPAGTGGVLRLYLPSWAPGSYLMREFARHVDSVEAEQAGRPVSVTKSAKDEWSVSGLGDGPVVVRWTLHAHELTVRANYLGPDRALLCGAATFLVPVGGESRPARLRVVQPQHWPAPECALPKQDGAFEAEDFDALVDAPLAAGPCRIAEFDVLGVPHRITLYGEGECDLERLASETRETCLAAAAIFPGGLPMKRYLFILQLGAGGGLEHAASSVCGLPVHAFTSEPERRRGQSLIAHEYFHVWNVKRIRPLALGPFDYRREAHSPHLWVSEGLTSWYQHLLELRAGHLSAGRYLTILAAHVVDLERTPGALVQSVEQSSFDAWIKYYRPGENSRNSGVSYYGKGAVIGLVLDLEIRRRTQGARSLDDVFRALWKRYLERPGQGFDEAELREAFAEGAGERLDDLLDRCVGQAVPLDVDGAFAAAGLTLERRAPKAGGAFLGVLLRRDGGRVLIDRIVRDSPAWEAGLGAGEELLAFDGFRVTDQDAEERLGMRAAGDKLRVTSALWGRLRELDVVLGERPSVDYRVRRMADATEGQRSTCESWLGVPWERLALLDEKPEEQRSARGPKEL